ncbi:zinc finger MYM-type protein 1-like protein [Tanacetum coccineum]
MIKGRKQALVRLKTSGFDAFLKIVNSICEKHDIVVLKMDEIYVAKRNRVAGIKNRQYFEIDIFNTVLDMQIQEFGDRFGGISIDLRINMSALSPDRFSLSRELDLYYEIVIHDIKFMKLTGIAELATRSDDKEYEFSYADLPRLSVNDVEDMYLLQVQDKLHHLPLEFVKDFNNALNVHTKHWIKIRLTAIFQLRVEQLQRELAKPNRTHNFLQRPQLGIDTKEYHCTMTASIALRGSCILNQ